MLKKIFAVLLSLLSIFCFCACGATGGSDAKIELTYDKKYIETIYGGGYKLNL